MIEENTNGKEITRDEIKHFINARYVGPVEACWRILEKPLQEKSHCIIRLPVHLPNQQSISIDDCLTEDEIRTALEKTTMLYEYFMLNKRDPNARNYYYTDIP